MPLASPSAAVATTLASAPGSLRWRTPTARPALRRTADPAGRVAVPAAGNQSRQGGRHRLIRTPFPGGAAAARDLSRDRTPRRPRKPDQASPR